MMRNKGVTHRICHNCVMTSSMKEPRKGCLGKSALSCGGLVIGIPLLILIVLIGLWGLGGILIVADGLQSSDAIVVLSGGDNERVKYAANLYRNGFGRYLILTETGISYPGNPKPATARAIDLAVDQGVPEELILAPEVVVNSTADEAQTVRNTAEASDFTSLIVVTDPYHTFRTRLIFRWIFRGSGIKIMVHPTSAHWYDSLTWFLSFDGWRTTLSEYIKTVGFLIGFR
jgi:uncharacterized SAM-binding protein YcdF (DUF218 family)